MSGKGEMRRASANFREKIFHIRRFGMRKFDPMGFKAGAAKRCLDNFKRASVIRRHRRAANEFLREANGVFYGAHVLCAGFRPSSYSVQIMAPMSVMSMPQTHQIDIASATRG